jgi:hypothetical protein
MLARGVPVVLMVITPLPRPGILRLMPAFLAGSVSVSRSPTPWDVYDL